MNPNDQPQQAPAPGQQPPAPPSAAQPATQPIGAKSKATAVILAVFLSAFSWLYTYQRDKKKFWTVVFICFVITVIGVGTRQTVVLIIDNLYALAVWIWAIVDTATKPDAYYNQYPNYRA